MDIQYYIHHRLNPFYGTAETVTTNACWDIYVSNTELTCGPENPVPVQTSDIR